jgi:hypothetical protein
MYVFIFLGFVLLYIALLYAAFRLCRKIAANRKMKRIFFGVLAALLLFTVVWIWRSNRSIGVYGDIRIVMNDGTVYELSTDDHFTFRDRGRKLGRVRGTYGNWSVFAKRGDPSREYIYVSSMGRGEYYKRSPA